MGSTIKKVVIFVLLAGMIVGYFVYLNNKKTDNTDKLADTSSPAYTVISRDLNKNYPATPKSVVAYYGDILKIAYKEELKNDEFIKVAEHFRGLFDAELIGYNSNFDTYKESLKKEIEYFKKNDMVISEFVTENGYGIEYKTSDKKDYAYVDAKLFIRQGKKISNIYYEYVLRKDESGKWHILTWYETDESSMD